MEVYYKKYDIGSKKEGKAEADIRRHGDMETTMLVLVVGAFSWTTHPNELKFWKFLDQLFTSVSNVTYVTIY